MLLTLLLNNLINSVFVKTLFTLAEYTSFSFGKTGVASESVKITNDCFP